MTTTDKGAKAPDLIIGWHTINRLRKEGMVEVNGVGLIAADDLFAPHTAPAPAPEIPEEMVEKAAALLINRGHYRVLDEADAAAWEILEAAGVPALLARVAEVETGLKSIAANTCCDRCQEAALVARAALAKKETA